MPLGSTVLVPLTNPASVAGLIAHAVDLTRPDGGTVVPMTVVAPTAAQAVRDDAHAIIESAEAAAAAAGGQARGSVVEHESVASAVLEAAASHDASLVLMGWRGRSTQRNIFGELIDTVVGRSRTPMAVIRLGSHAIERVLLPVSDEHLVPAGRGGVELATALTRRLGTDRHRTVRVLRTGEGAAELSPEVAALSDRLHHDPRRYAVAIGAAAEAEDLVVVPVAPTVSGLRTATTHVAWLAPEATLVVAIDVGPPAGDVEEATAGAGQPAPAEIATEPEGTDVHTVVVVARHESVVPSSREQLGHALRSLGEVAAVEAWEDADGRRCVQTRVRVTARSSNDALAVVMTALHESDAFRGAELRYELEGDGATDVDGGGGRDPGGDGGPDAAGHGGPDAAGSATPVKPDGG